MTVELIPITEEELTARTAVLVPAYAADLRRARAMSEAESVAEAELQLRELLPAGIRTDGMLFFTAVAEGQVVGWIWLCLPGHFGRPAMAWIYDVEVDAPHRGRGYGRAILTAAEAELSRLGVTRVGLNVFGDNTVALRLYQGLGYEVMSQQMAKVLAPPPTP